MKVERMVTRVVTPPLAANAYVVRNLMIDCGGDAEFILRYLSEKRLIGKIKYLLLTHAHFDHAGAYFALQNSRAKVGIHEEELRISRENPYAYGMLLFTQVNPDFTLRGGEILEENRIKIKVIHTPGHSPGSVCYYDEDRKWLFSGDTVFSSGGFGRVDFPGGNALELVKSLKKLTELDVEVLFPGHDEVVEENADVEIKKAYEIARRILL